MNSDDIPAADPEAEAKEDPIQSLAYDPNNYPHFIELGKANG